jgi:hypothetical protein
MAADINGGYGLPFNLQNLLRRTFVIESAYLNQQKLECLHEMREAKELVDKMRRKQTSLMNSLKLATGATSGTGDIDTKIFNLKTRMEKIKLAVDELAQRWADIESMCGFSITGPFGGCYFLFFFIAFSHVFLSIFLSAFCCFLHQSFGNVVSKI